MYLATDGARGRLPRWFIPIYLVDKTHGAYSVEEIEDAPELLVQRMLVYFASLAKVQKLKNEQAEAAAKAQRR